ncbi:MAG: sulfurtransferase TusA family protein [Rhodocyclaceae bacterium]
MTIKADVTIDYSGMTCPAPLLGAKKILDDLDPGQTLCLISDCSGTHQDLLAWCNHTGNVLVSVTPQGSGNAYLLRRAGKDDKKPIPHATLDMRGIACPGPILEAKKLLQGMKSGEILQLVSDCTAARDEIPLWGRETSIELLDMREIAPGVYEFHLRKG